MKDTILFWGGIMVILFSIFLSLSFLGSLTLLLIALVIFVVGAFMVAMGRGRI